MEYAFWVVAGFLGTLFNGLASLWVAGHFVKAESAPVAGFAFAIGAAGTIGGNATSELARNMIGIGAVFGLLLVWYLFFKRSQANNASP